MDSLLTFTKEILSRYNATPDEWDALECISPENGKGAPPRDGTLFLGQFGYHFTELACWSKASSKWAVVSQQVSDYEGKSDPYFETDYREESELVAWVPLPEVK